MNFNCFSCFVIILLDEHKYLCIFETIIIGGPHRSE